MYIQEEFHKVSFGDFALRLRAIFSKSFYNMATRFLLLPRKHGPRANMLMVHCAITFSL